MNISLKKNWLNKKTMRVSAPMLVALTAPSALFAQTTEEPLVDFGGSIYIEGRYVGNANRSRIRGSEVDELQTEYGANVFGRIDREIVALSADYDFYQVNYSEDTQEERFVRTGRSALVVGTQYTFYQLDVGHSTQRFLADPAGPTILANTDQRDITTVAPLLRLQPGRGNTLSVAGHFADVRYQENILNDSERLGYEVNLLRDTSPLHTLGLKFLDNEVDYRFGEEADYSYRRAALTFAAELRRLTYSLELGANEAVPDVGPKTDGIYYNLSVIHGQNRNTWTFTAEQGITDTSLGNANDPFFSSGISADVSPRIQDQLERRSFGLGWQSDFLCRRCDVSLRTGYEQESYVTVTTEDRTEIFGGGGLRYKLRPTMNLAFNLDYWQRDFEEGGRFDDYDELSFMVSLDIDPVLRYFDTRFWYRYEERIPQQGTGYSINAVGATLAYNF